MNDKTDVELVILAKAGDPVATGELFDRHRDVVEYWAKRFPSRIVFDEVISASYIRFAERIGELRKPGSVKPWLFSIARRIVVDTMKEPRSVQYVPQSEEGEYVRLEELATLQEYDFGDEIEHPQLCESVRQAVDRLNEDDERLIRAHYWEGKSMRQLASEYDVSLGQIWWRIKNAKERILGMLLEEKQQRSKQ